eukprot:7574560-Pyramimonas_sp.AAC.1
MCEDVKDVELREGVGLLRPAPLVGPGRGGGGPRPPAPAVPLLPFVAGALHCLLHRFLLLEPRAEHRLVHRLQLGSALALQLVRHLWTPRGDRLRGFKGLGIFKRFSRVGQYGERTLFTV